MSLFPLWNHSVRPSRIIDQHFGMGLHPEDFFAPIALPQVSRALARSDYYRPWRSSASAADTGSNVIVDKDKFQVNLDVQQFGPNEITVKASGDNVITIEGKHEEKEDEHGFISRHFVRKYHLPKGHDLDRVVSHLSSDGVLTITAPKNDSKGVEHRTIPVTHTGEPSKAVQQQKKEK